MADEGFLEHPDIDVMMAYTADDLSLEDSLKIAEHVAECDECAERSSQIFRLSTLWENWRHRTGEEPIAARVAAALRKLFGAAENTSVTARTHIELSGGLLGALSLRFDRQGAPPSISGDTLKTLLSPSAPFQLLAPAGVRGRSGRSRGQNSAASRIDVVGETGDSKVRLEFSDRGTRLRIELREWPKDQPVPVVVLLHFVEAAEPKGQLVEFSEASRDAEVHLDSPQGEFALVFVNSI